MPEIDFKQKLRAVEDVLLRELDGEAVILHLGDESYYGLNESGTRMWQALTSSESIEVAYNALLDEFDVDATTLKKDVETLVSSMLQKKMVTLS